MMKVCNGVIEQKCLRAGRERAVFVGEFGIFKKYKVIIKINKNENDKEYTKKEFNHTKLAYKLCYEDLYKISNNPLTKPIWFDKKRVVLSYIPGCSREWPFSKKSKMSDFEYCAATKYLARLHKVNVQETKGLEKEQYGGSSINQKIRDDYNKLKRNQLFKYKGKLDVIAKYIPEVLIEGNEHDKYLVYSHGDFKPDNIVFSSCSDTAYKSSDNCDGNKDKINIGVIDWIDFGLRLRQYDVGSLLFGLNLKKLNYFLDFYFKETDFKPTDKIKFLKEAIALACIVHINAPMANNEPTSKEKVMGYLNYAYKVIEEANKNSID